MTDSSLFPGGRSAALAALERMSPSRYGRSRNFLDGAVTRLSPYLRHGVLSLAEVRDRAVARVSRPSVDKFVQELGWRDYYRRAWRVLGDAIWDDLEAYKTGLSASAYADAIPADLANAETGARCIDAFVRELDETGYLHNHARMWFASYVVHHRRVAWQAGARFFLERLLDGDVASNNLSWQWVGSTFSHKPYFFNRENLERYSRGVYCAACPLATGGCPFAGEYGPLAKRLFPNGERALDEVEAPAMRADADPVEALAPLASAPLASTENAIEWVHDEALVVDEPARAIAPHAPAIFVWDAALRDRDPWSPLRTHFVETTVAERGLARIATGESAAEIGAFARESGAATIVAIEPVDPALRAIATRLARDFEIRLVEGPRFATIDRPYDLRRFSRYWRRAERTAYGASAPELNLG